MKFEYIMKLQPLGNGLTSANLNQQKLRCEEVCVVGEFPQCGVSLSSEIRPNLGADSGLDSGPCVGLNSDSKFFRT